jgi:hypothetical protein
VRKVLGNFVPVVISRGVVQLSAYIDQVLASYLGPAGAHEGETVVAVVERLERAAHEEWFDGPPGVIVSDVVGFAIVRPEGFSSLLFAHVPGHPRIGGRPLLLGDAVTFVLPQNWQIRDLELADLAELALAGGPD